MNPLVTLVVPTLNGADYLEETLSSVLAQDYSNLDILVSDNGSTDDSLALATALARGDQRFRFRRNEVTVPVHEHFNQCLEAARGEFFSILSDDDVVSSNFVSKLVEVVTRHPGINVVVPRNVLIDASGALIREAAAPNGEVLDGFKVLCDWLYQRTEAVFLSVSTVLGRTGVIRHFGGYQDFALGQNIDNLVFLQYAIGRQVGFSRDAVWKHRVHETSYAAGRTPRHLAKSSQAFARHLQRDPRTVAALAQLPAAQRKEIIQGVRLLGASVLAVHTRLHDSSLSVTKLRRVLTVPFHATFYRLVIEHYFGRLRSGLR